MKKTQTPLRSKQEILRKQTKQKDSSKSNKTGKTNLYMESTNCEVKTLMQTKETPISGYVVQA